MTANDTSDSKNDESYEDSTECTGVCGWLHSEGGTDASTSSLLIVLIAFDESDGWLIGGDVQRPGDVCSEESGDASE